MKKIIETERLYLRELEPGDEAALACVLCDPEAMQYYPEPFSRERVARWIEWNLDHYRRYGHGLWAVIFKKEDLLLGDCGITMQDIEGVNLPELGYHIRKDYWNQGYATEAAKACIEYGLETLGLDALYTYAQRDNAPSIRVAAKNGMRFVKHFRKTVMGIVVDEVLYCIQR